MVRSRLVLVWLPVVLWAAVIFAFSSIPSLGTGLGTWDTVLRKCAHVTEYAIMGALLLRALGRELPAFLAGVAYAAATGELVAALSVLALPAGALLQRFYASLFVRQARRAVDELEAMTRAEPPPVRSATL